MAGLICAAPLEKMTLSVTKILHVGVSFRSKTVTREEFQEKAFELF
jgi:hypothetical protein